MKPSALGSLKRPTSDFQVGLDIGTASTKIIVRDIVDQRHQPQVLRFGAPVDGYPPVATPTTIGVDQGRVYFGGEAEERACDMRFRSFKVCLACQWKLLECRQCPGRRGGANGEFMHDTGTDSVECNARDLFVLYLAWIRQQVKQYLVRHGRLSVDSRVLWNISVPIAQLDDAEILGQFRRMFQLAEILDNAPLAGMEFAPAVQFIHEALPRVEIDSAESPGATRAVPETLAGMLGIVQRPSTDLGFYGLVDVGAGTTDVAYFAIRPEFTEGTREFSVRGYRTAYERGLTFFSSGSWSIGGDDFDLRVAKRIMVPQGGSESHLTQLAALIRRAHNDGARSVLWNGRTLGLEDALLEDIQSTLAKEIWKAAHECFRPAWDSMSRRWRFDQDALPLFLVGGGGRDAAVEDALRERVLRIHRLKEQPVNRLELSDELRPGADVSKQDLAAGREFLLVAEGLSYPEEYYPRRRMPSEVTPMPPPVEIPPFRADDMYAK